MSKVKICGLSRPEDIQAANRCRPDYIGFVFASGSRRFVTPSQAARLKAQLHPGIKAVGVFVDAPKEYVTDLFSRHIIDIAQLHGRETESEIRWIREHSGHPVIKAVPVHSRADVNAWLDSHADYLLFDSGTGGSGQPFDWSLLAGCTRPYFLAGGLCIENLEQALATGAYAVDLSSGAETDGKKDPAKIAEILRIVRTQTERCRQPAQI